MAGDSLSLLKPDEEMNRLLETTPLFLFPIAVEIDMADNRCG
jgi:hypothetical protein